jgi:hypothetical protein
MSLVGDAGVARSILGRVVTIVCTGTSSSKHTRDALPAFALTPIDDGGLTTTADVLPLCWATWHRYSASDALTLGPLLP